MLMAGIITTTYTNIAKIKFIAHVPCAEPKLTIRNHGLARVKTGQCAMSAVSKKWMTKYLTMNKISGIIISERGR